MSLLDALVYGVRDILSGLVVQNRHSRLNFGSAFAVSEDLPNDCQTINLVSGGGTGSYTLEQFQSGAGLGVAATDNAAFVSAFAAMATAINQISITSSTNAAPINVLATAHGRSTGDTVNIDGHLVNTAANGQWVVTKVDANNFTLNTSTGNGIGAATGIVTGPGKELVLAATTYLTTTAGFNVPPHCTVRGQGIGATTVRMTANTTLFQCLYGHDVLLTDMRLIGNSTGASQIGIELGHNGSDGADRFTVDRVDILNMGRTGITVAYGTGNAPGPLISNCHIDNCATEGIGLYTQSRVTNCSAVRCGIGLHVNTGNATVVGCDFSVNTTGIQVDGGGNGAHGTVTGCTVNHCTSYSVYCTDPVANGFTFDACHLYDGSILINNSTGTVEFSNCVVDPVNYTFGNNGGNTTGAIVKFSNCRYPQGYYASITVGSQCQIEWRNCRALDGSIPPFIGTRMRLAYTFPGDANQTLTPQQSIADVIDIAAGTITVQRDITSSRAPTAGSTISVVNRTAFTVRYFWSTGTSISVPSLTSLTIDADGVNAVARLSPAFTAGGDLSGSSSSQSVVSLTGSGGFVPIAATGNVLRWLAATTAPGLAQVAATAGVGATMSIIAQAGFAGSNGGDLVLSSGSGTTAGNVNVQCGSGATQFAVTALTVRCGPSGDSNYWFNVSNGNGQARVNAPVFGGAGFYITNASTSGDAFYFLPVWNGASSMSFGVSCTSCTITQVAAGNVTAKNMTITAQAAVGGASVGGDLQLGGGTGNTAGFVDFRNQTVATSATAYAGGAAVPVTLGFLPVKVGGTTLKLLVAQT